MHFKCHATLGWAIGNLGGGDRRLRNYCALGAVLPDIDAAPFLLGAEYYGRLHHTFGHNVFLWALFVGWVTWRCRSGRAMLLSFLSFGSHLLTDAFFSGWDLYLFWPFSTAGYLFPGAVGLEHPINTRMVYYSFIVIGLLAVLYKRTPINIFSPTLDQMVVFFFRGKNLICRSCGSRCNQCCTRCQKPVCLRHGIIRQRLQLLCPVCVAAPEQKEPSG